jgi:hypothetical protein
MGLRLKKFQQRSKCKTFINDMKNIPLKYRSVLLFAILFGFSTMTYGQDQKPSKENSNTLNQNKEAVLDIDKTNSASKMQKKVLKLNHKKSNEIISIKAYRRSLNIKVKTVKIC